MLAIIRSVDISKRSDHAKSEFYTFSQRKGLKLFELVIMPYHGDLGLHIDDQEWENEGVEFWAMSKKTALSELTNNISLLYKNDLFTLRSFEKARSNGFRCQSMKRIYKDITGHNLNLENFSIESFLNLNDHYCYVLKKLFEKMDDLKEASIEFIGGELYFIDENQQLIKIKNNLKK